MGDSSLEDRERGEPEGEEGGTGRYNTGTDRKTDEEKKEEKEAGSKKRRGEERTREAGGKDGGRGEVRGGKEKASRKGDRGEEERPANGDCDSNTEKGERGWGGTGEEREKGRTLYTTQKWKAVPRIFCGVKIAPLPLPALFPRAAVPYGVAQLVPGA
jgi:hypothetical protein